MTIRERRIGLNMTQKDVERETGLDQGSLSCYENGIYKPKYGAAKKLAALYGCTIDEIMEGCVPADETIIAEAQTEKQDGRGGSHGST